MHSEDIGCGGFIALIAGLFAGAEVTGFDASFIVAVTLVVVGAILLLGSGFLRKKQ